MSEESKSYEPSELKLDRLRKLGVVPISELLGVFAALTGVLLGVTVLVSQAERLILSPSTKLFSYGNPGDAPEINVREVLSGRIWDAVGELLLALATMLVPCLLIVIIVGALQTKFLWTTQALKFDLSRAFKMRLNIFDGLIRRVARGLVRILVLSGWSAICWLLFQYVCTNIQLPLTRDLMRDFTPGGNSVVQFADSDFEQLTLKVADYLKINLASLSSVGIAAMSYAFFVGIISRFACVLQFRHDHRMTRAEVEAEFREMEPAPEVKAARDEFFQE